MQALKALQRRVMGMVGRCVLTAVNDDMKMQSLQLQVLAGEYLDDIERVQNYGFTSHPKPGAEGVVVFVQGGRDHGLVVAMDDRRYRLRSLQPGEVALYDDLGNKIELLRDKIRVTAVTELEAIAPVANITADVNITGNVTINGNTEISGNATVTGTVEGGEVQTAAGIILSTHIHSGVTPGSGTTGAPV